MAKDVLFGDIARQKMVKEVASQTSDQAGDGTTTATVLAQAIVREGMTSVAAGMNPMDLKRGIDKAVTALVEELKKRTRKITPLDVKAGDRVLFGKWSGSEVTIDGEELIIMKESDILGIVDKSAPAKK